MEYNTLDNLNETDKLSLTAIFHKILLNLKHISFSKAASYLRYIPQQCHMHHNSLENRKARTLHSKKVHPVRPQYGEIYNAFITEGVGSELCGNHLVVILQNQKENIYSEKISVLPIEGNGNRINPNYHLQLTASDMATGILDKAPSRIIISDIMTIDKSRLGRKIGALTPECLAQISILLRKHLNI